MGSFSKVVKDSLKYPFLDFKKFLLLGVLVLLMVMFNDLSKTIPVFFVLACLMGLFILGYIFRIIKLTLNNTTTNLPDFNLWSEMLCDGFKLLLITLVYALPIILILLTINPFSLLQLVSWLLTGISFGQYLVAFIFETGFMSFFVILYMIMILPVIYIALIYMLTEGSGNLNSAFRFGEVFAKVLVYGIKNIIRCYLITGFLILIIYVTGGFFANLICLIHPFLGSILFSLVLAPYFYIFVVRLTMLSYKENLQISKKNMISLFIGIVSLLIVTFLIFNTLDDTTQKNNIQMYNATTNTYSTQGVSFNYPSNWSTYTQTQGKNYEIYLEPPLNLDQNYTKEGISISEINSRDNSQFIITIEKNLYGTSDTDKINSILKEPNPVGWKTISSNILTIDGNNAYEKTLLVNDTASYNKIMILHQIYIVKNGTTYRLTGKAPSNDFENQKWVFDQIINSFKIK